MSREETTYFSGLWEATDREVVAEAARVVEDPYRREDASPYLGRPWVFVSAKVYADEQYFMAHWLRRPKHVFHARTASALAALIRKATP